MSESESAVQVTPWRIAASTVNLCDRCHAFYAHAHLCASCLREVDADPHEKRSLLLSHHEAGDSLSAIVSARPRPHAQRPRAIGALFTRGLLRD